MLSDTEIRGLHNVLMNMLPLSSVLVHFVGRMIHSFPTWQLKRQQIKFSYHNAVSLLTFSGFGPWFVPLFPLPTAPSAGFCHLSHLMGSTQIAKGKLPCNIKHSGP